MIDSPTYAQLNEAIAHVVDDNQINDIIYSLYEHESMANNKRELLNKLLTGLGTNVDRLNAIASGEQVNFSNNQIVSAIRLLFTRIYELEKPEGYQKAIENLDQMSGGQEFSDLYNQDFR